MEITLRTAFTWRHKILHAMRGMEGSGLSGIVEADETYFPLSFKGQRKGMPRPPRRRGQKSKKRGIRRIKSAS